MPSADEARLAAARQSRKVDVGVLGGVFGRLFRSATRAKPMKVLPEPATSPNWIGLVAEPALGERSPCRGPRWSRRRRARRRAAWCRRSARPRCRAGRTHASRTCSCGAILRTPGASSSGFSSASASALRDLARRELAAAEEIVGPPVAMAERDVAGAPRRDASEKPMSSACSGSSEEVSVSMATTPASKASCDPALQFIARASRSRRPSGRSWLARLGRPRGGEAGAASSAARRAGARRRRVRRALIGGAPAAARRRRRHAVARRASRRRRRSAGRARSRRVDAADLGDAAGDAS